MAAASAGVAAARLVMLAAMRPAAAMPAAAAAAARQGSRVCFFLGLLTPARLAGLAETATVQATAVVVAAAVSARL
jgi:hypothetical protein